MGFENDKLQKFSKAVYNEANEKVKEILSEAENSRQTILNEANDVSLNNAYEMIQNDIKKISSKYVKIVSKAELDAKREVLCHREELSTLVFANVKAQINEFTLGKNYEDYLVKLLKQTLCSADTQGSKNGIEIFLATKDMKYKDVLIKASNLEDVTVTEKHSIILGGLQVLFLSSNIVDDKTLDSALSEQKDIFNQSVSLRI